MTVEGDDDSAAASLRAAPAGPAPDPEVGDQVPQALGDRRDRPRVGVERLGVRKCLTRFAGP